MIYYLLILNLFKMENLKLTNPIDIKLAALVARKKSESTTTQIVNNKLWPSTLRENSISHYTSQSNNYNAIILTNKNYNG
jgi:hypothetical protein